MRLGGRLVGVVLAVAILAPVGYAYAESVDSGHQSVNIPPAASGPFVTQGNASFDSSGIAAEWFVTESVDVKQRNAHPIDSTCPSGQ